MTTQTAQIYDVGDLVTLKVSFRVGTINTDPTVITLKVKNPIGLVTLYTYGVDSGLLRNAIGDYQFDLIVDTEGDWWYRWQGTGNCVAAEDRRLYVRDSVFIS